MQWAQGNVLHAGHQLIVMLSPDRFDVTQCMRSMCWSEEEGSPVSEARVGGLKSWIQVFPMISQPPHSGHGVLSTDLAVSLQLVFGDFKSRAAV